MAVKCVFSGNVGKDAELRELPNGNPVLSFSVATSKTWVNAAGERRERTTWVPCSIYGRRALALARLLTKGTRVFVQDGELTVTRKETPNGVREYWGVTVHDLEFGSTAHRGGSAEASM